MSVTGATLRKLATLGLSADQMAGVLEILADQSEAEDARRVAQAERKRRSRDKGVTVTGRSRDEAVTVTTETPSRPSSPQTPHQPTHPRESTSREARSREDAGFAKFWAAYPRKTAKADARKAFSKAWKTLPPFDEESVLIGGLERAKAGWTEAQFIPYAATWLSGERWQDEPTEVIPLELRRNVQRPHYDAKSSTRQANLATFERGADLAARFYREPG
jgi:hypothetical protein